MSVSEMLLEQVERLFADAQNGRREGEIDFDPALWSEVEALGLPHAMCPEESGGAALGWSDIFGVIAHSAACGEPVPLGETLVANGLLCADQQEPAEGPIYLSVPPGLPEDVCAADAPGAPRFLAAGGASGSVKLISWAEACATSLAFDHFAVSDAGARSEPPSGLFLHGALLRSIQIAGALQGALDLSVTYTQERVQFGRSLSKFQAIQHMLAQLAGEAVATAAAARSACARMDAGDAVLPIAIAKLRAGRAVEKGVMLAHQIHGAIGVTMEYPLARLSRNMWRWCEEFGDHRYWAIHVARTALKGETVWDAVVAASDPVERGAHE